MNPRRHLTAHLAIAAIVASVAAFSGSLTAVPTVGAEPAGAPVTDVVSTIAAGRIDTGMDGSCVVRAAGWIQCWGANATGQNGHHLVNREVRDPFGEGARVDTGSTAFAARSVSRGGGHACAVGDSPGTPGRITCWGDNTFGQTTGSDPLYPSASRYFEAQPGRQWVAVTAGLFHSCALDSAAAVWCWGFNGAGQLGQGDTTNRAVPARVAIPPATAIAAGQGHACAVLTDGRVACWGTGAQGQLGNGATDDIGDDETLTPANSIIEMPGGRRATAISLGNDHTCALLDDGSVTCWGFAGQGRLGNGASTGNVLRPPAPIALPAPGRAIAVSAGGSHACAVLGDRRISCWGANADGKLGLGNNVDQVRPAPPVLLPGAQAAVAVAAGDSHTCALLAGDDVACWGTNIDGRAGAPTPPFIGDTETPAAHGIVELDYAPTAFTPLTPRRLLDTRPGAAIGFTGPRPGAGSFVKVPIPANLHPGGPAFVGAVVLNVTITDAAGAGYVTAFPSTQMLPNASNLNVDRPGQTIANLVTVQTGADGTVALYTSAGGHLIADLVGFYAQAGVARAGRLQTASTPMRVLDTRPGALINWTGPKPTTDQTLVVPIAGRGGVPSTGVSAVVLNVTGVEATAPGYVSVWDAGSRPNASSLNLDAPGQTLPNQVIVPLGADGAIRLYTERGAHLIVDVAGWFTDVSAGSSALGLFIPTSPFRHHDSRPNNRLAAGTTRDIAIDGVGHVAPAGVSAIAANVTAVDASAAGYVSVYPPAPTPPNASNLNVLTGQTVPNHITSRTADGNVRVFGERGAHLLVDVAGYYI